MLMQTRRGSWNSPRNNGGPKPPRTNPVPVPGEPGRDPRRSDPHHTLADEGPAKVETVTFLRNGTAGLTTDWDAVAQQVSRA